MGRRSTLSTAPRYLHIAAGALLNRRGDVLICQRPAHKIYPGEWEFPGGKVEPGETVEAALARELAEELGITVTAARPLIRLRHVYPELSVDLDTWLVTAFEGQPRSTEHPAMAWVAPAQLPRWQLLAADQPIVHALRLPSQLVFSPPELPLPPLAVSGPHLLRLRLPRATDAQYHAQARALDARTLILDRDPEQVNALGAAGFHATASRLRVLGTRPVPPERWFGASCHDAADLERARVLGANYAVLGPVRATATHPGAIPLGWEGFAHLAVGAGLPVYAIGGVGPADLPQAWRHGAQGVAGISAFRTAYWRGSDPAPGSAGGSSSAGIA